MNEETLLQLGEKAEQALAILGEKLGQGAEYVWPLIIKQQYILAMQVLLPAIIIAVTIYELTKFIKKLFAEREYENASGLSLLCSLLLLVLVITVNIGLSRLINPEYYALQEVFNLIK